MSLNFHYNDMTEEGKEWFQRNGEGFCLVMMAAGVPALKTIKDCETLFDRIVALSLYREEDLKEAWQAVMLCKGLSTNVSKRTEADIAKAAMQVQRERANRIRRESMEKYNG